MARPIPTDGQQVLRQLVKDVDYLKRTTATIQTLNATTGVQEETVYVSDPNGPPGSVTIGDVPLNEYVQAPGEVFDGDKETVTEGDKIWLVVPSAPICSTNQQAVTVTWDGFGAGGEDIPRNFGVLEIHRSLDEFFDVFDPELAGTTLVGVLTYPGSIVFTNQMYDTPYYYRFIMRAADGRRSGQSVATLGIAELIGSSDMDPGIFNEINDSIDAMNDSIAEAQDTADNAIASYAPEYAVSASDTVAPTTGWSTTSPVRTPGTYIWYRTTVTYGNGATSTTNPALLTGNDGAPGTPGTPAAVITLTATTQILASPAGGGATTPATSVVTGVATNTTITAWTYSIDGAAFSATVPPGVSRTANVVTITGSTMTAKTIAVRMADAGTVSDTLTVAKVTEGSTGGTGPQGPAGPAGADAYTILLSNEAQTFAAGTTNALAGSATTTVLAYKGSVAQVAHVGTITGGATGITAAITANDTTAPVVTFTVTTALTAANGTFTIPVSVAGGPAVPQIFTWSLAFAGAPGATGGTGPQGPSGTAGAPAADISLTATTQILSVAAGGAITPTTSVVTGMATNTTITAWTYSVDGAAFSATVPPGVSRTANVVTITGSTMTAKTIAVRMADAGTAVDTYTVAKVSDGATGGTGAQGPAGGTGAAGADGLTVLLSNEAATIAADTTKAIATTITSTVIAYKGTTQQSALVGTITGGAAGISAAVTNNPSTAPLITFTVTTALVAPNGTFTVPVTVAGVTVNQVFSWSLSFAGPAGGTGSQGPAGAPASIVDLVTTTQVLTSPAAGGATTPATAVLTGTATNTTIASWSYSVDGGTFTGTPPTGLVLAGNVVTITGGTMTAKTIAVRATGASGVTDTITVAKNYDGATGATGGTGGTGPAGADAYTVLLTNEAHTFPGTATGAITGSTTTTALAYKATTAQSVTIGTITGQVTGLTTSIAGAVVTVNVGPTLTTGGTLTIPVTVASGPTVTKLFSWSVSFAGATGATGGTGGTGATGVSVLSVTPYFYQVTTGAAAPALPTDSPPPAPWSATEPTYVPNTELYRTERVLYSSGPPQYTAVTKVSSYAAATAAMTSANGKNQIIYSTSDASGTSFNGIPFIDGDTWFKYRTDVTPQTVSAQWRFLTGAWVSQKVDGANLAYLDAGTITTGYLDVANRVNAGSIDALKIKASTIRARELALADTSNLCEINESSPIGFIFDTDHVISAGWSTRAANTSTWFMFRDKQGPVPFKTGDRIRLVFEAYADAAVTGAALIWGYGAVNVTDTFGTVAITATSAATAQSFALERTLTADYTDKQTFLIGLNGMAGRNVFVRNARAYLMNAGELIVDGSITARHIGAQSITADKIALGAFGTNMIADPSFEENYPLLPSSTAENHHWSIKRQDVNAGNTNDVSRVTDCSRSGQSSVRFQTYGPTLADEATALYSNAIPVVPGEQWTFNCYYARLEATGDADLYIRLAGGSTPDTTESPGTSTANRIPWTDDNASLGENISALGTGLIPLSEEFNQFAANITIPAGINYVRAYIRNGRTNETHPCTIYVDDVSFTKRGQGATEITSAGVRLFGDDGQEMAAMVSNRANIFQVTKSGQTLAGMDDFGGVSAQTVEVRGQSELLPITSYTHLSNVVTVTTSVPHGYDIADPIFVSGLSAAANGAATVLDILNPMSFTYSKTGTGVNYTVAPDGATVNSGTTLSNGQKLTGFTVYGTEFMDWLDAMPRGVLAWENFGTDKGPTASAAEVGYGEIGFQAEPGRLYRVSARGGYDHTVANAGVWFKLRLTSAIAPTAAASPTVTSTQVLWIQPPRHEVAGTDTTFSDFTYLYNQNAVPYNVRILLTYAGSGTGAGASVRALGTGVSDLSAPEGGVVLCAEDIGKYTGQGGAYNVGGAVVTPIQTYVKTFTSNGACSYMGTSGLPKDSSQGEQDMKQGYSSYDGDSRSLWTFPAFTGAVGAQSITKVRLYLYANHWYYSSGGTALIKSHTLSSIPATGPSMTTVMSSSSWPKPGGRWVTLPSSVYAGIIAGTLRGFGVGPAGTSNLLYYGRFNKSGVKVEITYKR